MKTDYKHLINQLLDKVESEAELIDIYWFIRRRTDNGNPTMEQRLKRRIWEQGKNYSQCAAAIGRSRNTFYSRLAGKSRFTIEEMEDLGNFLNMTGDEKTAIFFGR